MPSLREASGGRDAPAQESSPEFVTAMSPPAGDRRTGIAYLGCGYVADFYQQTFANHRDELVLRGVWDVSAERLARFVHLHGLSAYADFDALLADPGVEIVVNLTNPRHHYDTTKRCLLAGKHVYSEKPLALALAQAEELTALAQAAGLQLVCAPSSVLGDAARTMWTAVRERRLGAPRLVYAEIDEGMIHRLGFEDWISPSGAPWPAEDELRTGCTLEHAGYMLSWLVAMFGPVERVVSVAALCIEDKGPKTPAEYRTPDFSCALLSFGEGVIARLTNSVVAPHDHQLRIFCDEGELRAREVWDFNTPVHAIPLAATRTQRRLKKWLNFSRTWRLNGRRDRRIAFAKTAHPMNFALGIADMARAIRAGRAARLGGVFALHITEVTLAIQYPDVYGTEYVPKSRPAAFSPLVP